jgi:hypothetical protein
MTLQQLQEIALHAVKGTVPANYTAGSVDMNAAFVDGLKELAGSFNQFMHNKHLIYDIVVKAADEVMPKKVIDAIGMFAEVQSVGQGQKAIFKRKVGRARAKKFLTQVGVSGVYETFRLDSDTFELGGHAVGGGATVDFERVLDGAESLVEVMDVITEGLTDAVFYEVQKALRAAFNAANRPDVNKYSSTTFQPEEMVKLMNVVRAYGNGVVIFATPEFVGAMGPDAIVPVGTNYQGVYHPQDIDAIHNNGYITIFRGAPIVQIPQSFIDEKNDKTWIDPQLAYILPTGGEKIVKVVLEGPTVMWDAENRDQSMEVFAYKKMGCAILTNHNWAIYQNTGIAQTFENPYGF